MRPTGIIRTLPNLHAGKDETAHGLMLLSYQLLAAGKIPAIYIALSQKPTIEVLHLYVLIDGKIIVRMNIADYVRGEEVEIECWDGESRNPKWWAVCTAPISYPPATIERRGFQGFRYTEDLW